MPDGDGVEVVSLSFTGIAAVRATCGSYTAIVSAADMRKFSIHTNEIVGVSAGISSRSDAA
jgi:hypothetical protein